MDDSDRKILELFAARVRELFPGVRVWAFGSRARGEGGWDSDFDTCVVLDRLDVAADQTLSAGGGGRMMSPNLAALMQYRMEQAATFVSAVAKECRRLIDSA